MQELLSTTEVGLGEEGLVFRSADLLVLVHECEHDVEVGVLDPLVHRILRFVIPSPKLIVPFHEFEPVDPVDGRIFEKPLDEMVGDPAARQDEIRGVYVVPDVSHARRLIRRRVPPRVLAERRFSVLGGGVINARRSEHGVEEAGGTGSREESGLQNPIALTSFLGSVTPTVITVVNVRLTMRLTMRLTG